MIVKVAAGHTAGSGSIDREVIELHETKTDLGARCGSYAGVFWWGKMAPERVRLEKWWW
jgi:hypothetical protein